MNRVCDLKDVLFWFSVVLTFIAIPDTVKVHVVTVIVKEHQTQERVEGIYRDDE